MDDCRLPHHERALRIACEAEFTAMKLRGLRWLLCGWLEFLNTNTVTGQHHDEVHIFLTGVLDGLADTLDRDPWPDGIMPTEKPTGNGGGLHVVRPEPVA